MFRKQYTTERIFSVAICLARCRIEDMSFLSAFCVLKNPPVLPDLVFIPFRKLSHHPVSVPKTPRRGVVSGIHIHDPGLGSRMSRIGEFKRSQQNLSGLKRCPLETCLNECGIDSRSSDSNALGFHGRATQCNHYAFHRTFRPSVCRYRIFFSLEIPLFSLCLSLFRCSDCFTKYTNNFSRIHRKRRK